MSASAKLFGLFKTSAYSKKIDLTADDIYVMLVTTAPTATQQDTWQYKSDVTGEVANGNGYTTGGQKLTYTSPTVRTAYNASTNTFTFDADDVTWPSSTITAGGAVLYSYTSGGTDAARCLIGYVDFGSAVSTTSGTFQIVWNSSGIFSDSVA